MPIPATLLQEAQVPNEWPSFTLVQNTAGTISTRLTDSSGEELQLDSGSQEVTLVAKEYEKASELYLELDGTVSGNTVNFTLSASDLPYCGVWLGEITVANATTHAAIHRRRCYIEVEPTLSATLTHAPLTVAEVRMAIRDRAPEDNDLLEKVEFSNSEIMWAIRRPVDFWNESLPPIDQTYTAATFPYRYNWLDGIVGELLRMAGMNLLRNRMPTQLTSGPVDMKARGELYANMGNALLEKYQAWVRQTKYALNMDAAFMQTTITAFG